MIDLAESFSPRLRWLADHNLITRDYQDRANGGYAHHSLNTDRWLCANRANTRYASGPTEQEAEINYAVRYQIPNYQIAGYDLATGSAVGMKALARVVHDEPAKIEVLELALMANKEWDL